MIANVTSPFHNALRGWVVATCTVLMLACCTSRAFASDEPSLSSAIAAWRETRARIRTVRTEELFQRQEQPSPESRARAVEMYRGHLDRRHAARLESLRQRNAAPEAFARAEEERRRELENADRDPLLSTLGNTTIVSRRRAVDFTAQKYVSKETDLRNIDALTAEYNLSADEAMQISHTMDRYADREGHWRICTVVKSALARGEPVGAGKAPVDGFDARQEYKMFGLPHADVEAAEIDFESSVVQRDGAPMLEIIGRVRGQGTLRLRWLANPAHGYAIESERYYQDDALVTEHVRFNWRNVDGVWIPMSTSLRVLGSTRNQSMVLEHRTVLGVQVNSEIPASELTPPPPNPPRRQ